MFESGGGGSANINVRPAQLRTVAHGFATHQETTKAEAKAFGETGRALPSSIHHPAVAAAVQGGATALLERMALGLGHCDSGLTTCAATYEKGDEASAQAADSLAAQWGA